MRRWFLVVLLLAILGGTGAGAYWLLNRDETPEGEVQDGLVDRFGLEGVPFTFLYPDNFATAEPPPGTLWIAGIGPSDAIDVRRVLTTAPDVAELERIVRRNLTKLSTVDIVDSARILVADQPGVAFVIDSTTGEEALRSRLVYFTADGATWQIGCQAEASAQVEVGAACDQVIGTLAIR